MLRKYLRKIFFYLTEIIFYLTEIILPHAVFVRPQKFITATTRGAGPFIVPGPEDTPTHPDSNRYEKSMFYVFAFRDTLDFQGLPATDFTRRSDDLGTPTSTAS